MNKLFKNWEECLKKQNNLIFVDVREYFKYIRNNFREMKYVNHNADNHKSNYYKVERNLISKKEELFKKGDISKWELDSQEKSTGNILSQDKSSALFKICSKDTNTCIQRRIYYGYYLNKAIEEFERVRALNGKFHKENFMNLLKGERAPDNSKSEMIQILRKLEENDNNELDYEQETDSNDSEDEITNRFSELNLDKMNSEAIWEKMTDKEKEPYVKLSEEFKNNYIANNGFDEFEEHKITSKKRRRRSYQSLS